LSPPDASTELMFVGRGCGQSCGLARVTSDDRIVRP
jgi:hypothetical protein